MLHHYHQILLCILSVIKIICNSSLHLRTHVLLLLTYYYVNSLEWSYIFNYWIFTFPYYVVYFFLFRFYHQYIPFCNIFFSYLFIDILNYASITVVLLVDWQKDTGVTHTLKDWRCQRMLTSGFKKWIK